MKLGRPSAGLANILKELKAAECEGLACETRPSATPGNLSIDRYFTTPINSFRLVYWSGPLHSVF